MKGIVKVIDTLGTHFERHRCSGLREYPTRTIFPVLNGARTLFRSNGLLKVKTRR
jgi:hypothetical protein